jgi:hypothetical protein
MQKRLGFDFKCKALSSIPSTLKKKILETTQIFIQEKWLNLPKNSQLCRVFTFSVPISSSPAHGSFKK